MSAWEGTGAEERERRIPRGKVRRSGPFVWITRGLISTSLQCLRIMPGRRDAPLVIMKALRTFYEETFYSREPPPMTSHAALQQRAVFTLLERRVTRHL